MTAITLSGVSKRFGDAAALADISIEFPSQRVTAVIGRSGCGKSTLLRACNGLVKPDAGTVAINERAIDYDALPELRRARGLVVDWRAPNILRLAPVPLYNRFVDAYRAAAILEQALH